MATIGTSALDVFPLALGGNTFGWTSDEATSHQVLDAFVAGGGDFIDTADGYSAWAPGHSGGESETVIGSWLKSRGRRDDVVIGTKVSQHPQFRGLSATNVRAAAEASLRRLQTDHIDLYYAHFDDPEVDLAETVAAFDGLVNTGKVRYVGLSNYSAERVQQWVSIAQGSGYAAPVALQPHYNLVSREPFEGQLAPVAAQHQLGVVPYFSLASGFLTGKYRTREDLAGSDRESFTAKYFTDEGLRVVEQLDRTAQAHGVALSTVALAWLQSKPTVVAPIASARNPEQLADLLASATVDLAVDEVAALDAFSDEVTRTAAERASESAA
ncbi:aldo/keto reductase [Streptomyces sp. NP160]|uniref:aldo/keto reductase n=1 Tax=Streptomyces sp. NP160 TaxID=2586637 RepID=UPI00111B48DA|nr:aldo/keto reductase [Streptomyces sp. NP160]TNM63168.1 aldo/keto reductase [Streptomyces sp. NP160]